MVRVLLVEDDPNCQTLIGEALRDVAELFLASGVGAARSYMESHKFDLVMLDIGLPDGDGYALCSEIAKRTPVVLLTANHRLEEKLKGFASGAIDYIVKPVDFLEVRARLKAHLGRIEEEEKNSKLIKFGSLTLDLGAHRLLDGFGKELAPLTRTEFTLLHALAKHEGQILSREQLAATLSWREKAMIDRTVDAHICKLRRKLQRYGYMVVASYGMGYRLAPMVAKQSA